VSWTTLIFSSGDKKEDTDHIPAVVGIIICVWVDFFDITSLPYVLVEFESPLDRDFQLLIQTKKKNCSHYSFFIPPKGREFCALSVSLMLIHMTWGRTAVFDCPVAFIPPVRLHSQRKLPKFPTRSRLNQSEIVSALRELQLSIKNHAKSTGSHHLARTPSVHHPPPPTWSVL